ncbi:MAG: hypothetical protein RLY57_251 [Candidatus Parcubacteria bacterium]|jgi:CYTH domain-containing protein
MKTSEEIERKWLVTTPSPELQAFFANAANISNSTVIRQGYLRIDDQAETRLREGYNVFLGKVTTLTFKSKGDLVRIEHETRLERKDALNDAIFATGCVGKVIEKTRFKAMSPDGTTKIEIDLFKGHLEGLILIEVEFRSEDAARDYILPKWLSDISREVTDDKRYKNASLAVEGLPA